MKIAWIFHDRAGYTGGPAVNAVRMLSTFKEMGHEAYALVQHQKDCPNAKILEANGITCFYYPEPFYSSELTRWIMDKISEIQPDIFVPNISIQGCFAGKWIKKARIPVINAMRSDDENNWGRAAFCGEEGGEYQCTGMVFVNKFLQDQFHEKYTSYIPTSVIPSGVPIPKKQAIQYPSSSIIRIVYAGRLSQKQKRVIDLVQAFITCAKTYPQTHYTLIGDGGEKSYIQKLIHQNGLRDRIILTGTLRGEAYKEKLLEQQIIVLLSDYEGMPGSLMDGMSCGLIPLSLKTTGIESLIQHEENGFIVKDREKDFIETLGKLIDSTEREQLATKARQRIIEDFSLESAAKAWISFYQDLIEVSGPKAYFVPPSHVELPALSSELPEHVFAPSTWNKILAFPIKFSKHIYHQLFIKSYGA